MSEEGYHPNKSRVNEDTLANFIRSPVQDDLLSVPGIGKASVEALNAAGIYSTFQLIGQYLLLKEGSDVTPVELAERFYLWLKSTGTAAGQRSGTVRALAEKLNIMFPGIYDESAYDE